MDNTTDSRLYWDEIADEYQQVTRISTDDFHYGPLLAGDKTIQALPQVYKGMKCLELGGGAAQNSFYLASKGADCVTTDISIKQLKYAEELGVKLGLDVRREIVGMDEVNKKRLGSFDLIHSTWALPFANDQEVVVRNCAEMLNQNGRLVLTTGHPIFAGEWIELEEHERGMFVANYFDPPTEVRFTDDEDKFIRAKQYPISTYLDWLISSGLTLEKLIEHKPVELEMLSEDEITQIVPYDSSEWREMYEQIKHVPFVVTYIAVKK